MLRPVAMVLVAIALLKGRDAETGFMRALSPENKICWAVVASLVYRVSSHSRPGLHRETMSKRRTRSMPKLGTN